MQSLFDSLWHSRSKREQIGMVLMFLALVVFLGYHLSGSTSLFEQRNSKGDYQVAKDTFELLNSSAPTIRSLVRSQNKYPHLDDTVSVGEKQQAMVAFAERYNLRGRFTSITVKQKQVVMKMKTNNLLELFSFYSLLSKNGYEASFTMQAAGSNGIYHAEYVVH